MRLLLDTHALLWWLFDESHLSETARSLIGEPSNIVHVSSASIWEIGIKVKAGKLQDAACLLDNVDSWLLRAGFTALPITPAHASRAGQLPLHHKDPFDRMLIAQAQLQPMTIVSTDPLFAQYDVTVLW